MLHDILFNMFLLQKPKETVPTLAPKTLSVAAAFNEDDDVSRCPVLFCFFTLTSSLRKVLEACYRL